MSWRYSSSLLMPVSLPGRKVGVYASFWTISFSQRVFESQLALVVLYPAATSADSPLAHMVAHPLQLALVVLFHPPTGANTALALGQLALCGGGLCGGSCICASGGYIYNYIYKRFHLHTWWFHPLQLAPVMFSLTTTGTNTKLMLGQLALCGGVF